MLWHTCGAINLKESIASDLRAPVLDGFAETEQIESFCSCTQILCGLV